MSDPDELERTVVEEGISLTKSYETDEFPVPTVDFHLRSERDDGAMVRVVDAIPDGVPSEDLGFHPDYGGDDWMIEGDSAVFERHVGPGEEHRTIYGVRTDDHDPERFMTDPTIDVSGLGDGAPTEAAGESASAATESDEPTAAPGRDSSQAARDVIAGDRDVAGLDGDDTTEAVDISGTEPAATDRAEAGATTGGTGAATGEQASGGADSGVPEGEVGAALATELRNGDLSQADRELLAEELDTDGPSGEVRLTHLQSRISDLEAYTDALEEFIDENGPARQLIEDLTQQVETIEDELDDLDERTSANERAIERLTSDVETNAEDIDALDTGIADVEAEIEGTQESVADLRADIEAIEEWRERISSVLGGVSEEE
jgi:archaellum component FlaC